MVYITLALLAFVQNMSFTLVSRARNRDNTAYHVGAAMFSNGVWFLTFRELVQADMSYTLFIPYLIGSVLGSLYGANIAIKIENLVGAKT